MPSASVRLFLVSFSVLFLELAVIRWLNASVYVLGYFNNLILIGAFMGLGAGALLSHRDLKLIRGFAPALLLLVAGVYQLAEFNVNVPYQGDVLFATNQEFYDAGVLEVSLSAIAGFGLTVALFAVMGDELGRQLLAVGDPLRAYAWDIGGSLTGVLAFSLASSLGTPPHVWFVVGSLPLLVIMPLRAPYRVLVAVCVVAASAWAMSTYPFALWTPYYKFEADKFHSASNKDLGFRLSVDNVRIQDALLLGEELEGTELGFWNAYYALPYDLQPDAKKVLVLGAGSGNDVAMAQLMGMPDVQAVEIDPLIAEFGRVGHPHKPYRKKDIKLAVDDARAFVTRDDTKYDLIVMSALDSHKQVAGMATLRLESFVYTVEAYRAIQQRLAPGGVFVLKLSSSRPWMGKRTYWTLAEAIGEEPAAYHIPRSRFRSVAYVVGPPEVRERAAALGLRPAPRPAREEAGRLATDDWPHLYLENNRIPPTVLVLLLVLIALSVALVVGVEPAVRRPNLHFFLLGAGFMLLETSNITGFALLFGTTWAVNAVVIGAILFTVLVANRLVQMNRSPPRRASYALLFVTLVIAYFFPLDVLTNLAFWPRVALSMLVVGLPMFWASLIFSASFRDVEHPSRALGSNLLGVVFGGALEYTSTIVGLRFLLILALIIYVASALPLRSAQR